MKKLRVKSEELRVKAGAKPEMPIWKTAKHGTAVQSKITLPHVVDLFTAEHLMADALPFGAAIVSIEVKYVMFSDYNDSKRLGEECWKEYIDCKSKAFKKGGAK